MGTVYLIHNNKTKRSYIGSTMNDPLYRVKKHFCSLKGERHRIELMQQDYDKYGKESFSYKFIGSFSDEETRRMEIFYMQLLRTKDPRYGYNYKDKSGTSKWAVHDRWRTPTKAWNNIFRKTYIGEVNA